MNRPRPERARGLTPGRKSPVNFRADGVGVSRRKCRAFVRRAVQNPAFPNRVWLSYSEERRSVQRSVFKVLALRADSATHGAARDQLLPQLSRAGYMAPADRLAFHSIAGPVLADHRGRH